MKQTNSMNKDMSLLGLFSRKTLEELQMKLAEATGFSVSIIDYRGGEIIPPYIQKEFAEYTKKHGADPSCQMSAAFAAAKAAITNLPYIYLCQCGLVKAAIPVVIHEQYLGAIICGYVPCKDPDATDPKTGLPIVQKDFPMEDETGHENMTDPEWSFSAEKILGIAGLVFYLVREMSMKEEYSIRLSKEEHNHVHLQEIRKKNVELSQTVKNLEMNYIKKDLNPQVLVDMLITLSNFAILEDAPRTRGIIESFTSILRYYIAHNGDIVSLNKEMVQVEKYLRVMESQYDNRFSAKINREGILKEQKFPKLILFLLVQYMINSTVQYYGYRGILSMDAHYEGDRCLVSFRFEHDKDTTQNRAVSDLSAGMSADEKEYLEKIPYIEKQLYYVFQDNYKLTIESDFIALDMPKA